MVSVSLVWMWKEGDRARRAEGGDDVGRASAHAQKRSGQAAEDSLLTRYQRATPCPDRSRRTLRYLSCRLPVCDRHSRSLRVNRQSLTAGNHGEPTRYARNGGRSGLSCGNIWRRCQLSRWQRAQMPSNRQKPPSAELMKITDA